MSQNVYLLALTGPALGVSQGVGPVSSSRRDLPFNVSAKEKCSCAARGRAVRARCPSPYGLRPWLPPLSYCSPGLPWAIHPMVLLEQEQGAVQCCTSHAALGSHPCLFL